MLYGVTRWTVLMGRKPETGEIMLHHSKRRTNHTMARWAAAAALALGGVAFASSAGAQGYDGGGTGGTATTGVPGTGGQGSETLECLPSVGGLTSVSGSLTPGSEFVVGGDGFKPGSEIQIYVCSTPIVLGGAIADGGGGFQAGSTVPTDLGAGEHLVVASGVDPDGDPLTKDVSFKVTSSPSSNNNAPSSNNNAPSSNNPPSGNDLAPVSLPTRPTPPSTAVVVPVSAPAATVAVASPSANTPTIAGAQQVPVAGQLGNTGTSAGTIAMVAAAVVLVGSALVLGARRRRQG